MEVEVLERLLRNDSALKYRLQIGDNEFQAATFRLADGGWQLSLLPAEPESHPVVRLRVEEQTSNDVPLVIDDMEAALLAIAGSMADRLQRHAERDEP